MACGQAPWSSAPVSQVLIDIQVWQTSFLTYRGLQVLVVIERSSCYGEECDQLAVQFLNNLSFVLIGLGKDAEALSLLVEAIERDPGMSVYGVGPTFL